MVAAGARAHAGPWSRRCRPPRRADCSPELAGPAGAPAPPRPFIALGARGPSPGGFAFQSGGSLRAANQRGKPVGGGGFKRRQIAAPSGRRTGWGLEGVGARRARPGRESEASLGAGVSCGPDRLAPPTPRPPRSGRVHRPWPHFTGGEKGSEGRRGGTPGQRRTTAWAPCCTPQ